MPKIVINQGPAAAIAIDPQTVGAFLQDFDPLANDGYGKVTWTKDIELARRFDDFPAVMEYINVVPTNRPLRDDGMPNKPMFAYHLEIVDAPDV